MDPQAWIAFAAAILLALITLFSSYNHVFIPGFATSFPLPQQAGIPCIFIALAAAAGELKLASNSRYESAELRARAGALFQLELSPERLSSAQLQPAAQGQIKFSQVCGLQLPNHSADRGSGHREQLVGHEL